jgi:hypothetical protein
MGEKDKEKGRFRVTSVTQNGFLAGIFDFRLGTAVPVRWRERKLPPIENRE